MKSWASGSGSRKQAQWRKGWLSHGRNDMIRQQCTAVKTHAVVQIQHETQARIRHTHWKKCGKIIDNKYAYWISQMVECSDMCELSRINNIWSKFNCFYTELTVCDFSHLIPCYVCSEQWKEIFTKQFCRWIMFTYSNHAIHVLHHATSDDVSLEGRKIVSNNEHLPAAPVLFN